MKHPVIEIMDTTLRDGEQTSGVSFMPHEKLMIARLLLEELKVDRVEVASARVSEGEARAVKMICDWAARRGVLQRVEVLGFVDGHQSVDWIHEAGCRIVNLLCKGSLKHCTYQLKKTPEEHLRDIRAVVDYAGERGEAAQKSGAEVHREAGQVPFAFPAIQRGQPGGGQTSQGRRRFRRNCPGRQPCRRRHSC